MFIVHENGDNHIKIFILGDISSDIRLEITYNK